MADPGPQNFPVVAPLTRGTATIYLIRHARAGRPEDWPGDDRLRPLTARGRRQAEALGRRFEPAGAAQIVSSPYQRCLETVAPLANRLGIPVNPSPVLAQGEDPAGLRALVETAPDGTVLCSHGDLILALLEHLVARGVVRAAEVRAEKGSTWVLRRVDGKIVRAERRPAPETTRHADR